MRLLAPAALAWISALLAIGLQAAFATWAVCAAAACLITVWCVVRRRGGAAALLAVSLAAASFVSFSASVGAEQRRPDAVIDAGARDAAIEIVATIGGLAQATDRGPGHLRVKATLTEVDGRPVRVPVTLFGSANRAELAIGSSVTASGRLILTAPTDDSSALVFVDEPLTVSDGPPWYLAWAHDMRRDFVDLCSNLPGAGGRLLPGLAVGDTSAVDAELDAAMKTSSLSHLTAVSGETVNFRGG